MSSIYLDWNLLSYMSDLRRAPNQLRAHSLVLRYLLRELGEQNHQIPFSVAHFQDISRGDNTRLNDKLLYLREISDGWEIGEDNMGSAKLRQHKGTLDRYYRQYLGEQTRSAADLDAMMKPFRPFLEAVRALFLAESTTLDLSENQTKLLSVASDAILSPDPNDRLRLAKIDRKFGEIFKRDSPRRPSLESVERRHPHLPFRAKVDLAIRESEYPANNATELKQSLGFRDVSNLSPFANITIWLSVLCELLGASTDKLKKSTAILSQDTDRRHLIYGLRCSHFVTNDEALFAKATFIKQYKKLPVRIERIDGFVRDVVTGDASCDGPISVKIVDDAGETIAEFDLPSSDDA